MLKNIYVISSIKPNDKCSSKDRIIEIDTLLSKMKSDDEGYS